MKWTRQDLIPVLTEALNAFGKRGTIVQVCEYIWKNYEQELRNSGDLFFTWQYDVRWAATVLRQQRKMKSADLSGKGVWELN